MFYKYHYSLLLSSFCLLFATQVQAFSLQETGKNVLMSRNDTSEYNSSSNPLLFPTKPQEVKIENTKPISLKDAVEIALKNNEELQVARLQLERSQEGLNEALATKLPTVNGQLEMNQRSDDTANVSGFTPRDRTVLSGQIEVSYNVYDGGNRNATINRSRRQIFFDQLEVERISEKVRFDATNAYYELQNADAQVEIAKAAIEDFTQTLRDARLLEQAGLGTQFDVLQAEVDLAQANQNLAVAISNQKNARRRLVDVLNVGEKIEFTAADEIAENGTWDYSLEESIIMAYKNRAELEQLLVQRDINAQDKKIALAQIRPQVDVFANYNFSDNLRDSFQNTGYADGYNVGARLNWQIFDGGQAKARSNQENVNIKIDETNFSDQKNQIRLSVESAYNNLVANKENIKTTEKQVETAVESLRLARLRFQAGVGTQTDVINAQRSLTEARGNFLQAIIGYNQSLNELQRAVSNLPDSQLFQLR